MALPEEDCLERELSCGICLELYDDPLQLPCMHTFCRFCLVSTLAAGGDNKKLKCPDCRKKADLGRAGINSLKRNFKLSSIVDIYRQVLQKSEAQKGSESEQRSPRAIEKTSDRIVENDFAFVTSLVHNAHGDSKDELEPHIVDELWGTFRRRARRRSPPPPPATDGLSDEPPVPPPRRVSVRRLRPLPPIPGTEAPLPPPLPQRPPVSPRVTAQPPAPLRTSRASKDLSLDDRILSCNDLGEFPEFDVASAFSASSSHTEGPPETPPPLPAPRSGPQIVRLKSYTSDGY